MKLILILLSETLFGFGLSIFGMLDPSKIQTFLNITENHFYEIAETFRNKDIWSLEKGKWKIKNFPIADWCW